MPARWRSDLTRPMAEVQSPVDVVVVVVGAFWVVCWADCATFSGNEEKEGEGTLRDCGSGVLRAETLSLAGVLDLLRPMLFLRDVSSFRGRKLDSEDCEGVS